VSIYRDDLIKALPYARRYARALSGSQSAGDAMVAEGLRVLLEDPGLQGEFAAARHALYAVTTSGCCCCSTHSRRCRWRTRR
jgi:hypothetical protein